MSNAKSSSAATLLLRAQIVEAVKQGFLDSALAANLTTAKSNGYATNGLVESDPTYIIGGVNR